jgi:hypothetical protein
MFGNFFFACSTIMLTLKPMIIAATSMCYVKKNIKIYHDIDVMLRHHSNKTFDSSDDSLSEFLFRFRIFQ